MKTENKANGSRRGNDGKVFGRTIITGTVLVVCLMLLSIVFLLTVQYYTILNDQVENRARLNSEEALQILDEQLSEIKTQSALWAGELSLCENQSAFLEKASSIHSENNQLVDVLQYTQDGFLHADGEAFETKSSDERKLLAAVEKNELSVVGVIFDSEEKQERIAVCVPARSSLCDSMVMMFDKAAVSSVEARLGESLLETPSFFALCTDEGEVLYVWKNEKTILPSNENVLESFRIWSSSKDNTDKLTQMFSAESAQVLLINVNGAPYAVSVARNGYCGNFAVFSLSRSSDVYQTGYDFLSLLLGTIVALLVIIFAIIIYIIISKARIHRRISNIGIIDERLGCHTLLGFTREAIDSVERYKGSTFAVVSMGVRRFDYITEVSGVEGGVELLRKIRVMLNNFVKLGECYGYDDHGEFLILAQFKQKDTLIQRLRELYRMTYSGFSNQRYSVKLYFGIYVLQSFEAEKMDRYISNAKLAMNNGGLEKMNGNYTMYDESVRNSYLQISDVEIRTDYGIRNREFRVFYQPKYNVDKDCIDGCEALVRWYDEKNNSYRAPDSFLPMMEANGFISRLDHYVFLEVCRFISDCVAKGQRVVPVSVNISRLTALDADFVEYYVSTKNHYKIPDNFITLELTESVAYENYGILVKLMKSLRQNGFECSIDDFGVGYSSYDLLKQIDIDEVKLDKFFIEDCLTNPRARVILENTVQLVNKLGVKVTQEGVEDEKTFEYVKSIGCKVIQGFYYSKPITETELVEFVNKNIGASDN